MDIAPEPPVAIEVWNEPWIGFWQPTPDPVAYYNLVKAFATEAWKVWPQMKILVSAETVGSTNTTGTIYWRKYLLEADPTGFLNDRRIQPTTHNYVEAGLRRGHESAVLVGSGPLQVRVQRLQGARESGSKVWVTEYGWESAWSGNKRRRRT